MHLEEAAGCDLMDSAACQVGIRQQRAFAREQHQPTQEGRRVRLLDHSHHRRWQGLERCAVAFLPGAEEVLLAVPLGHCGDLAFAGTDQLVVPTVSQDCVGERRARGVGHACGIRIAEAAFDASCGSGGVRGHVVTRHKARRRWLARCCCDPVCTVMKHTRWPLAGTGRRQTGFAAT